MIGNVGHLRETNLFVGAAHPEHALPVFDVGWRAFHDERGKARGLGDDLVRGAIDRRPRHGRGSRAPGAVAERNPIGVAFDQMNVVDRQPETVAAIWLKVISWPCPCEWLPAKIVTLPSLCTRTTALSQPPCKPPRLARLPLGPVPALSMNAARPMPIRTPRLRNSFCSRRSAG